MALTHLVDASALTRFGRQPVYEVLTRLMYEGRVARAGITDLEMGNSARNAGEWLQIQQELEPYVLVETDARHIERARQVQRMLAAKSQRGRKIPDLLVAAAAEVAGLVVLHYDADFDRISAVTGQPCEWIVPAGSLD